MTELAATSPSQSITNDILREEYNRAPYLSHPFHQTHPSHLYTLARLFGLKPKGVEKARILELGCASGGNIIPLAYHYPNAEILGIDLAERQIEDGIKHIQELNLKNITLRHQSIADFTGKEGKFDYIICHGVYSWVNSNVREKILEICHNNLAKNGIAYVSYNTFPGWNMVNSVRELMCWHTQNIEDPNQKALQARNVLKFITEGLKNDNSPYAAFLRNEINLISQHADSYLLHEHLSSFNTPVYFHEFMTQASEYKLSYLADAVLETMFSDNLPPIFANELKKVNNIIATSQYMDFIRNQRFRCTLLCHQDQTVNRALKTTDIENFYLQFSGRAEKTDLTDADLGQGKEIRFMNNNITYTVKNHIPQQAMLILLQEQYQPITYDELCKKLMEKSGVNDIEQIKQALNEDLNLMRAALAGFIKISSAIPTYTTKVSTTPLACPLARYQAIHQEFVANRRHQAIKLNPLSIAIFPFLDGTHDVDALVKIAEANITSGKLSLLDKDKQPITDTNQVHKLLTEAVNNELRFLAINALLIN